MESNDKVCTAGLTLCGSVGLCLHHVYHLMKGRRLAPQLCMGEWEVDFINY